MTYRIGDPSNATEVSSTSKFSLRNALRCAQRWCRLDCVRDSEAPLGLVRSAAGTCWREVGLGGTPALLTCPAHDSVSCGGVWQSFVSGEFV